MNPLLNPTGYLIGLGVKKIVESISESGKSTTIDELEEINRRAQIKATALLAQAKVEQELAIARRIDSAEEVEIEEYYDTSGKGNLGFSGETDKVTLGLGGEGRRVTKRVIKFKGCTPVELFSPETGDV
ncbi:hypothetical protein H5202_15105 [Shewanella sp. SG41-4]|uniref:hypothetical protein n=1 Tax=Shewanella sp. SG41-4 TaxID=2760976 RepID=UPI0016023BF1|nr:hypothetical protein [Shewanella sp. SG41-4]MBB1439975.1 hypothetical protein [Shewanella sp. SG41-4]